MKATIIIPTYSPGEYIYECLDSITKQTLPIAEFETLIILNGPKEPYYSKLREYIYSHSNCNIQLIYTELLGVSNARNIGIDNAKGDYITFLDDDDVISPFFLQELLLVSSSSCVGCSNSYCFIDNINEKKSNFLTNGYKRCKDLKFSLFNYRCFLSPPVAKLIHKNIIGDNRFPLDLRKSEDSVFCMRISPNIRDMKLASADAIYYQRLRKGSSMRTKQSKLEVLKEHLYIEWKYITEWCKHPLMYNAAFVLSRIVACAKNCMRYLRN